MKETNYEYAMNIAWQIEPVENFVYIYNFLNNNFLLLESVSKYIWECIPTDVCASNIAQNISAKYNIDFETAVNDVKNFLETLFEHGVVKKI